MRKTFCILSILCTLTAHGQFSLQPRLGISQEKYFVAAMDLAYKFGNIEPALTINDVQNNKAPAFFGARIGYVIGSNYQVMPIIGRTYRYMSSDKTEYTKGTNYWLWEFAARVQKGPAFLQLNYTDNFQLTIGVIVK